MDPQQLLAEIGLLSMQLKASRLQFDTLLGYAAQMITGELALSRCMVNKTENSFSFTEPGMRPQMPGTINGKPECVIAPCLPEPIQERLNGVPEEV